MSVHYLIARHFSGGVEGTRQAVPDHSYSQR